MILAENIKENSIEKLFCKPFEQLPCLPIDIELTEVLQMLQFVGCPPVMKQEFLFRVIQKRVDIMYSYELSDDLICFLCVICETPGTAVMYLTYLQYWAKNNKADWIDLDKFTTKVFPNGFPAKNELNKLWDNQKIKGDAVFTDNLLDYAPALYSLKY